MIFCRKELESVAIPNTSNLLACHDGSKIKGVILTTDNTDGDISNNRYDFISRYFAAWNGIPEDPVTG